MYVIYEMHAGMGKNTYNTVMLKYAHYITLYPNENVQTEAGGKQWVLYQTKKNLMTALSVCKVQVNCWWSVQLEMCQNTQLVSIVTDNCYCIVILSVTISLIF